MHTDNSTFHLTRGCQTLTIAKLGGRFIGLIDGYPYIVSASPDIVVRHLVEASAGKGRQDGVVKKNDRKNDPSALVRAARRAVGDTAQDATPLSAEEKALMNEVRREAGRPSKTQIREEARKLLK